MGIGAGIALSSAAWAFAWMTVSLANIMKEVAVWEQKFLMENEECPCCKFPNCGHDHEEKDEESKKKTN